jgi:serine phosphatase RsbU (regulator of sigma subunit)
MSKVIPEIGTSVQSMSNAASVAQALERRERQRVSTVLQARRRIADKLRVGVGTFENIVRRRVKRIDAAVHDRLQALLVQELEQELARLSHELEIARQSGARLDSQQVSEIETHFEKVRALLNNREPG